MGRRIPGVASLAFASTALAIPGCGEQPRPVEAHAAPAPVAQADDGAAPEIVAAKVSKGALTIRFSKPVVVPADLDPSKFRLTFGYNAKKTNAYTSYYYATTGLARTWYTDLSKFSSDTKVKQPSPDTLQIPLPEGFKKAWVCDDIKRSEERGDTEAGLYLHYAESKTGVADAKGRPLHAVAPYWLTAESSAVEGDFDGQPLAVSLRCK